MRSKTKNALLSRGFATDLIDKIERHEHTVAVLDAMSKGQLGKFYDSAEVEFIAERIKRQPISEDVLDRVIDAADGACCYCEDGDASRPYQIHHIDEYAASQDNSEDNLLLVCPTHHVSVPKNNSQASQKVKRRRWHALVSIAKAYRLRGIQFPFGRFVSYDYGRPPSPAQLLEGYRVTASTALALATSDLSRLAERRLTDTGFLLLLGSSGSGKTTLAVGVAGQLATRGHLVFRYESAKHVGENAVAQVMTFLATADRPCVLILDDANIDFHEHQLAEVQAASGKPVFVIATWPRADGVDDPRIERQFPDAVQVNWTALRPSVRDYLIENQATIVPVIQKCEERSGVLAVGLGRMNVSLADYIARYDAGTKTVSEFLFLLRGGTDAVRQDLTRLIEHDRADVPVLYAAIEQIAGFERTVSPGEAASACPPRESGELSPSAKAEWVEEVFLAECRRGRMHRRRGEFSTVHRDWAKRLIGVALGSEFSSSAAERHLSRDLDCRTKEPLRLERLLSWLWYDEFGGPYVRKWIAGQQRDDWAHLVGAAADQGLSVLGLISDRLHTAFLHCPSVTKAAFAKHEEIVSLAIQMAGPEDWRSLRHLSTALRHADSDLAARVIQRWDPAECAVLLNCTTPIYYHSAEWFFSSVQEHSAAWVAAVGHQIQWDAFSRNLDSVQTGAMEDVFRCNFLLTRLGVPQLRSMIRRYGEVLRAVLRNARLCDIRCCPLDGMVLNIFFPLEFAGAIDEIDPVQAAKDLETGSPRTWATFSDLSLFGFEGDNSWAATVTRTLSPDRLFRSVEMQAPGNEHELRVLLWALSRGSEELRPVLAEQLYPSVFAAAKRSEIERKELIRALASLNLVFGVRLANDLGEPFDASAAERDRADQANRRAQSASIREQVELRDQQGDDYDVTDFIGPQLQ